MKALNPLALLCRNGYSVYSMQWTLDLSVRNLNGGEEVTHRSPKEIIKEIAALDTESAELVVGIRRQL